MNREMSKKEFSEKKKQLEQKQRIQTIKRYGGDKVNQMFSDGEITEREAYEHSKSEMLGVEGVKSKGSKSFVISSKIDTSKTNFKTKENTLGEYILFDISKLRAHPLNDEIYSKKRDEEDEDLRNSIKLNGLLEPIVVLKGSNQVISGHRRWRACLDIGLKEIPIRLIDVGFDVVQLIQFNKYREKSVQEKKNETRVMKEYIKSLPPSERKRILQGTTMRDYISKETGISRTSIHNLEFIEKHQPLLLKDIEEGKISIMDAYSLVKSNLEGRDIKLETTITHISSRIKKISNEVPREKWIDIINKIYG